jgi:hypothetical protein
MDAPLPSPKFDSSMFNNINSPETVILFLMGGLKCNCALCAWKAHQTQLRIPFPICPDCRQDTMAPPSAKVLGQPPRPPSPPGCTEQRYAPRKPIQPLYGLSCCLLQYLQVLDTSKAPNATRDFFRKFNYPSPICTTVYETWSPDIDRACGFIALTNLASIEIIISTRNNPLS